MIGRKKRRDINLIEETENNDLHKNKNLLEYQNKCLATMIEDLKRKLEAKEKTAYIAEKRIETLSEIFTLLNCDLSDLNSSITKILFEQKVEMIPPNSDTDKKIMLNSSIDILHHILACVNFKDSNTLFQTLNEQLKSIVDTISGNFTELVNVLIKLLSSNAKLKSDIEAGMYENLQGEFLNEFSSQKKINEELQKNLTMINETHMQCVKEIQVLKAKEALLSSECSEYQGKIEDLNNQIFGLTRKINTNPVLPYIHFEKKLLGKVSDEHQCICHLCGNEMILSGSSVMPSDVPMKEEGSGRADEGYLLLTNENESLKSRIRELHEIIEKYKTENIITEERLLTCKPFQNIIAQAENMLGQLDSLRETNIELQRQKIDLLKEKENDSQKIEAKYLDKIEQYGKAMAEMTKNVENDKLVISSLNMRIESLENLLKSKEVVDINGVYEAYNQEKQKLIKQMDSIKQLKKEYLKKYEDETEKNRANEKVIYKLNQELDKLKSLSVSEEKPPSKQISSAGNIQSACINVSIQSDDKYKSTLKPDSDKYKSEREREREKHRSKYDPSSANYKETSIEDRERRERKDMASLKRKEEKIILLTKEIQKLEADLKMERENSDKLINELEVNEKGLDELNKKLKGLMCQLQESTEKFAKMANEKLKDMSTIKILNEDKETLERKNLDQETLLETYSDYSKKIENDLNLQKEINSKLESEIKIKEDDIEILKKEIQKFSKLLEHSKALYDESQAQLKESVQNAAKNATNFDQMKTKYEELCKIKNLDSKIAGHSYEEIYEENKILSLENDAYKVG